MSTQSEETQNGDNIPQKKKNKSNSIKDRVRKHVNNKDDKITDDDIRNAEIDTGEQNEEIEKKENELEKNSEVNEGNQKEGRSKVTPWDVLDND